MKTYTHILVYSFSHMRLTERQIERMRDENLEILCHGTPFDRSQLSVLLSKELFILAARFGFLDGQAKTLEAIGNKLGITRQRVHFMLNRALIRLRSLESGAA